MGFFTDPLHPMPHLLISCLPPIYPVRLSPGQRCFGISNEIHRLTAVLMPVLTEYDKQNRYPAELRKASKCK
jgi:hypothetical protein